MLSTSSSRLIGATLAGAMVVAMVGEATAAPINNISQPGYYGRGAGRYVYNRGGHYRRNYGGANIGAAIGLGILGLGLGAIASNGGYYNDDYYDGGYAPVYAGGYVYGYGYQPYYGYGYQPRYYGGYGYRYHPRYYGGYGYRRHFYGGYRFGY